MWLTPASVAALFVLSASLVVINHTWSKTKQGFSNIKSDAKPLDETHLSTIIKMVAFSKLWFRKQFNIIDAELQTMEKGVLRSGLVAVREEYSTNETGSLLNWQIEQAVQGRKERLAILETLSSNILYVAFFIAFSAIAINAHWVAEAGVFGATLATPSLITIITALALLTFVIKPLTLRLEKNLKTYSEHLTLCAEGVVMIQDQKTPATIRALLEGMTSGLELETKSVDRKHMKQAPETPISRMMQQQKAKRRQPAIDEQITVDTHTNGSQSPHTATTRPSPAMSARRAS